MNIFRIACRSIAFICTALLLLLVVFSALGILHLVMLPVGNQSAAFSPFDWGVLFIYALIVIDATLFLAWVCRSIWHGRPLPTSVLINWPFRLICRFLLLFNSNDIVRPAAIQKGKDEWGISEKGFRLGSLLSWLWGGAVVASYWALQVSQAMDEGESEDSSPADMEHLGGTRGSIESELFGNVDKDRFW